MFVNADELITALESRDGEIDWYLDIRSGDVLPLFNNLVDEDTAFAEALEAEPDRYLPIDPIDSHEAFCIMEAFVAALPAGDPATRLASALSHRRPFRQFKEALFAWPSIREQWFRFHDARMREIAQSWLSENGLDAHLTDLRTPQPEA